MPTPRLPGEPPLKNTLWPPVVVKCSSLSPRQVSDSKSKSNSNVSSSTIKSSNRSLAWMLCKFLATTCNWMNSSWTASFIAEINGPRTVDSAHCLLPCCPNCPYSMLASNSAMHSFTVALTCPMSSAHCTSPSSLTVATCANVLPLRTRTWNHL